MLIKVTQQHIDAGASDDQSLCPIALAIRSAGAEVVNVHQEVINNTWENIWDGCNHTTRSKKFVTDFDAGKKVKPQNFRFVGLEKVLTFK